MSAPGMVWLDPRRDLPDWLFAGIGRIAAEWSLLEYELEETIRVLLDVDVKRARIITAGMNARSRLACISNMMQMRDIATNEFQTLRNRIEKEIENERNKIVHSLWGQIEPKWYIIRTGGKRDASGAIKLSRAVLPERIPMSSESFEEICSKIQTASNDLIAIRAQIASALPPSQHKSPQQLSTHYQRRVRKGKAVQPQPPPSRP